MEKYTERQLAFARAEILRNHGNETKQREIAVQYGLGREIEELIQQSLMLKQSPDARNTRANNRAVALSHENAETVASHQIGANLRDQKRRK